jgi:hypothetical protein
MVLKIKIHSCLFSRIGPTFHNKIITLRILVSYQYNWNILEAYTYWSKNLKVSALPYQIAITHTNYILFSYTLFIKGMETK